MVNNYLIVKWFGFQMNFQISDRNLNFLCCVCQMIETRHFLFGFQMFLAFSNFQTEHLLSDYFHCQGKLCNGESSYRAEWWAI